ncbi:hypothetical protein M0R45_015800 [Rubus argutus]|uniref:Uncharacterized protein n=1 Tax=Rubus argutus TaxID=59490 RepID=A0AAW1XQ96_RUBAR
MQRSLASEDVCDDSNNDERTGSLDNKVRNAARLIARAWWSEKLTVDRASDLIAAATTLQWLWRWIEHELDCE